MPRTVPPTLKESILDQASRLRITQERSHIALNRIHPRSKKRSLHISRPPTKMEIAFLLDHGVDQHSTVKVFLTEVRVFRGDKLQVVLEASKVEKPGVVE